MRKTRAIKFGFKFLQGYKLQGIALFLTRQCNLDCIYCNIKTKQKAELGIEDWKKIINKLAKNKHAHFIFTGGEPLLYPGIYELIRYASKTALVSIITNGTLIDKKKLAKLTDVDFFAFSFDTLGKTEGLEKNSEKVLDLIKIWSHKNRITLSAIITITSKNTSEVPEIIKKLNCYRIPVLLSLIHSGHGYDLRSQNQLEFKTLNEQAKLIQLQNKLLSMKAQGYRISESPDYIKNMINYIRGDYQIRCPAAIKTLAIDSDGKIKACQDLPASNVSALTFTNYNKMKRLVGKTVPQNCNCYYDCYFNSQFGLKGLASNLWYRVIG
jgi:MoaA/NifB/PqqE/SkfB family radical SAM enzyme